MSEMASQHENLCQYPVSTLQAHSYYGFSDLFLTHPVSTVNIFKNNIMFKITKSVIITETRPWGRFERFTLNERSTIKLVYLDGDKRLSLQYHDKRSEFWKVVKGPVKVQLDKDTKTLQEGESITIPRKTIHRLIGAGIDATILEISTGEFEEDDIVRLEDDY